MLLRCFVMLVVLALMLRAGIWPAACEDGDASARALNFGHRSGDAEVIKFDVKFVGAARVAPAWCAQGPNVSSQKKDGS